MELLNVSLRWLVGLIVAAWLGLPLTVQALIWMMILDIASGILVAWQRKAVSSEISGAGMARKAMTLLIVGMAGILQIYLAPMLSVPLASIVAGFYVATEGISILENAAEAGLPIPDVLRNALAQLKEQNNGQQAA